MFAQMLFMSRAIYFLFCLLIFTRVAYGQGTIIGTITAEGAPVPQAVITILHTTIGTYTNDSGKYTLSNISPGRYTVQFSAIGYATFQKELTVEANSSIKQNIALRSSVSKLDEVTVTGVTRATALRKNPVPIAVITLKDMDRQVNSNIIDAIVKGVPGVSGVTTGPNITKPFIRGLGYNRVLTLYDGIRQEGQQWGDEHGIEADQYAIERIEVVKGPASLVYGSDAIAGVINMLPAVPKLDQKGIKGSAIAEYHTNNGMFGLSAGFTGRHKAWYYTLRTSTKTAHDYQNKVDGFVYNTGYREYNASGSVGVNKNWGSSRIGATLYDNLQEIPDGSRDSVSRAFTQQVQEADDIKNRPRVSEADYNNYGIAPLYQHIRHYRVYNHTQLKVSGGDIRLIAGFQQNNRKEFTHPTAPKQAGLSILLNTLNYDATYNYTHHKHWTGAIGINGMYQQNNNKAATDFPIPNHHLLDVGTYLFVKRAIGKFDISGGLRYDTRKTGWDNLYTATDPVTGFGKQVHYPDTIGATLQYPGFAQTYTGVSGSLGATFNAGKHWLLKANVARGYRAPNITEIGSNGLDPGAHIVYLGNRDFVPEFSLQQDLGVIATFNSLSVSMELYNNNIENYIYQARAFDANGNPIVISAGNVTYKYQQSRAHLFGGELHLNYNPASLPWLSLSQSASYTEGRNRNPQLTERYGDAARYLPLIPPLHLHTFAGFEIPINSKRLRAFNTHLAFDWFANQDKVYAVDGSETPTKGYQLVQAGADITLANHKGHTLCHIALQAENLLNTSYQSHLNRLKYFEYYNQSPNGRYGICNMGRNISLKVNVPIGA